MGKASRQKALKRQSGATAMVRAVPDRKPWLWIILAAALAIKIAYLIFSRESPFFEPRLLDPGYYNGWARRIAAGEIFFGPREPFFYFPDKGNNRTQPRRCFGDRRRGGVRPAFFQRRYANSR